MGITMSGEIEDKLQKEELIKKCNATKASLKETILKEIKEGIYNFLQLAKELKVPTIDYRHGLGKLFNHELSRTWVVVNFVVGGSKTNKNYEYFYVLMTKTGTMYRVIQQQKRECYINVPVDTVALYIYKKICYIHFQYDFPSVELVMLDRPLSELSKKELEQYLRALTNYSYKDKIQKYFESQLNTIKLFGDK